MREQQTYPISKLKSSLQVENEALTLQERVEQQLVKLGIPFGLVLEGDQANHFQKFLNYLTTQQSEPSLNSRIGVAKEGSFTKPQSVVVHTSVDEFGVVRGDIQSTNIRTRDAGPRLHFSIFPKQWKPPRQFFTGVSELYAQTLAEADSLQSAKNLDVVWRVYLDYIWDIVEMLKQTQIVVIHDSELSKEFRTEVQEILALKESRLYKLLLEKLLSSGPVVMFCSLALLDQAVKKH